MVFVYTHAGIPFYSRNSKVKGKTACQGTVAWKIGNEQVDQFLCPKGHQSEVTVGLSSGDRFEIWNKLNA